MKRISLLRKPDARTIPLMHADTGISEQRGAGEHHSPGPDLTTYAANLEWSPEGYWISRKQTKISYPEEGNANCLALESDSFWFAHRSRCILAAARRFPPPGMLFDVGGGNGYVASSLQQADIPVALVEPGRQGVINAAQRGVRTLVCSTLEDAQFYPGTLPAVGLFDVLEHIAADAEFLKTVYDLLIPGGRVYLTVPAYPALWSADDDYAGHHRRYTLASLRRTLAESGFRVAFASYFFFLLPPPIFLFRTIPTRLGLRKQEAWDSYRQEHKQQSGLLGGLLGRLLEWEYRRLSGGKTLPMGGSLLAVAEKPVNSAAIGGT